MYVLLEFLVLSWPADGGPNVRPASRTLSQPVEGLPEDGFATKKAAVTAAQSVVFERNGQPGNIVVVRDNSDTPPVSADAAFAMVNGKAKEWKLGFVEISDPDATVTVTPEGTEPPPNVVDPVLEETAAAPASATAAPADLQADATAEAEPPRSLSRKSVLDGGARRA